MTHREELGGRPLDECGRCNGEGTVQIEGRIEECLACRGLGMQPVSDDILAWEERQADIDADD